jgi:hypothetical protein
MLWTKSTTRRTGVNALGYWRASATIVNGIVIISNSSTTIRMIKHDGNYVTGNDMSADNRFVSAKIDYEI